MTSIKMLQRRLRQFGRVRDWGQYHTPKNIVMALSVEVGELMECFQWLTPEQSWEPGIPGVEEEVADVAIYLLTLADKVGVDIESAIIKKIGVNEKKYPPGKCRGLATKYNKL